MGQRGQDRWKILYIKASLTSQKPRLKGFTGLPPEPGDIVNHRLKHSPFPNDTTLNQWFDEQTFESYRKLGIHIVEEVEKFDGWKWVL